MLPLRRHRRQRHWSCLDAGQTEQPAGPTNVPEAFHVYSMRQAIEEGFILDVLQNYTTYKLAFKLAHDGKEYDETEVERSRGDEGHHALGAASSVQHLAEGSGGRRALS